MLEARALIHQKRYREARILLKPINHPAAKAWLKKLDKVEARANRTMKAWKADQEVRSSERVRRLPGVSQGDLDFMAEVHRRLIEEALRDADATIRHNPRTLSRMYPESDLTPALDLGGEVHAVSALVAVNPDDALTVWKTVICLGDELAEVRASLGVRRIQELVSE
jgi:hypothetical protein